MEFKRKTSLYLFLTMMLVPDVTYAGAFCLAGPSLPPQCYYDDAQTCAKAAEPPTTSCVINPQSYFSFTGDSSYCVVHSAGMAECFYIDRAQCNDMAAQVNGLCVNKENISNSADPYKYDPRVQGN